MAQESASASLPKPPPRLLHRLFFTSPVRLQPADAAAFVWLQRPGSPAPQPGWVCAADIETPELLGQLALLASKVRDPRTPGAWLILVGVGVVGLISYKQAPSEQPEIEIGYGVAPAWRGRGVGQRALAGLIEVARADGRIAALTARTDADNLASRRVLARNGFGQVALEGTVLIWRLPL